MSAQRHEGGQKGPRAAGNGQREADQQDATSVVLTARLLQVHYSFHRAGAALLTRMSKEEMGGEAKKAMQVEERDCRRFDDLDEAMAFTRATVEAGDVIGIGWSPDEVDLFRALGEFGAMLARGDALVTTFGPSGAATSLLSRDNLPHAAAVMGTALMLGLHMTIEECER